jgi:hypothetical protein
MSYDVNQEFGLGLKIKDIQAFIPEGNELAVYYPYKVTNGTDVTKDMLIKYGFFDQYAKLAALGSPDSTESPAEIRESLIEKVLEDESVFVDPKQALYDLLKAQKASTSVVHNETEGLIYAVIDVYLSFELKIPNVFEISSSRFGTVLKLGGMIPDESYLIFRQWSRLGEDGLWYDPRTDEDDKKMMDGMKKALVGEAHPGFELLNPVFGG